MPQPPAVIPSPATLPVQPPPDVTDLRPVDVHHSLAKKMSGVTVYTCTMAEKFSTKWKQQKRLVVVTAALLLVCEPTGSVRRVIDLADVEGIFLQQDPEGIYLLVKLGPTPANEPDLLILIVPDKRNTHDPATLASIIASLVKSRRVLAGVKYLPAGGAIKGLTRLGHNPIPAKQKLKQCSRRPVPPSPLLEDTSNKSNNTIRINPVRVQEHQQQPSPPLPSQQQQPPLQQLSQLPPPPQQQQQQQQPPPPQHQPLQQLSQLPPPPQQPRQQFSDVLLPLGATGGHDGSEEGLGPLSANFCEATKIDFQLPLEPAGPPGEASNPLGTLDTSCAGTAAEEEGERAPAARMAPLPKLSVPPQTDSEVVAASRLRAQRAAETQPPPPRPRSVSFSSAAVSTAQLQSFAPPVQETGCGWTEHKDPVSQLTYYHNEKLGKSTWHEPEEMKAWKKQAAPKYQLPEATSSDATADASSDDDSSEATSSEDGDSLLRPDTPPPRMPAPTSLKNISRLMEKPPVRVQRPMNVQHLQPSFAQKPIDEPTDAPRVQATASRRSSRVSSQLSMGSARFLEDIQCVEGELEL